jgi:hypothetical protein
MTDHDGLWRVLNTWNGGTGGITVRFTSTKTGNDGHNECFQWIHDHTPFSFYEATTHQGYKIEPYVPAKRMHYP